MDDGEDVSCILIFSPFFIIPFAFEVVLDFEFALVEKDEHL